VANLESDMAKVSVNDPFFKSIKRDLCFGHLEANFLAYISEFEEQGLTCFASRKHISKELLISETRVQDVIKRLQYRRFSFESYTQVYLAWGLLLLSLGQDHEAEVRIGEFIRRYGIPEDDPILRQARQKAKEASSNMPEAMARQHIDLPSKTLNVEPLQPIISPLKLDDLGAKSIKELLFGSKWKRYRDSLRKQLADRGLVPDSAWGSPKRLAVARKIEGILAEVCWGENFRFAPNDPYAIVGEFEIGDLSELDGVMAVEKEFGIKILWKEITAEIGECPTFGQFVDYVMRLLASNRPSPSGRSTAANP
jgi:hypothetical protein